MRNILNVGVLGVMSLLVAAVPLFAHHGNANYETKALSVKGTVTAWVWSNPHAILKFDAQDDKGNVVHWVAEEAAPYTLVNSGFSKDTFKVGDKVTVNMSGQAKNGAPVGRVRDVVLSDGRVMRENNDPAK